MPLRQALAWSFVDNGQSGWILFNFKMMQVDVYIQVGVEQYKYNNYV